MLADGEDTETLIDASLAFVVTHRTHQSEAVEGVSNTLRCQPKHRLV